MPSKAQHSRSLRETVATIAQRLSKIVMSEKEHRLVTGAGRSGAQILAQRLRRFDAKLFALSRDQRIESEDRA